MTMELKELIQKDNKAWRQAAIALVAAVTVLGLLYLFLPRPKPAEVAEEPAPAPMVNPYQNIRIEGKAAIVYDLATGEILYSKNPDTQLPLASLTKLLTVYAALEALPLSAQIPITERSVAVEGESGVTVGESFSLENAAKLSLVASSNDVTEAIEEAAEKRRSLSSRELLASAAQALQLTQTYAHNGTGLDVSTSTSGGYGSAYDVARLAGALVDKSPDIAEATTRSSITVSSIAGFTHTLPNTNQTIMKVPGAMLSKTGFTDLAGGNLVVVYDAGMDHRIAIVVLGSSVEGRFSDVSRLIDATTEYFAAL